MTTTAEWEALRVTESDFRHLIMGGRDVLIAAICEDPKSDYRKPPVSIFYRDGSILHVNRVAQIVDAIPVATPLRAIRRRVRNKLGAIIQTTQEVVPGDLLQSGRPGRPSRAENRGRYGIVTKIVSRKNDKWRVEVVWER